MSSKFSNHFYHNYNKNIHSQNGEDGVIEELLRRLNIQQGWVCEFGAWDGIYLSNTFRLVENGFSAVFIEGDKERFHDLLSTQQKYPQIECINEYVNHIPNSEMSLDNLLKKTNIPLDFDILSIDIDSFDYQVWKSLDLYKPKIVIIEINSSISPDVSDHIHSPGVYQGTSFLPTYNLGIEKGYTFVIHTGNMIFIKNELYELLNINYSDPLENFRPEWLV